MQKVQRFRLTNRLVADRPSQSIVLVVARVLAVVMGWDGVW